MITTLPDIDNVLGELYPEERIVAVDHRVAKSTFASGLKDLAMLTIKE